MRLALAISALDRASATAQIIELATEPDERLRIEAARCLLRPGELLSPELVTSLALMLARDAKPDVRAQACRALSEVALISPRSLVEPTIARLREMLDEEGAIVPLAGINGMLRTDRVAEFSDVMGSVQSRLQGMSRTHPSRAVRQAASEALNRSRKDVQVV